MHDLGIVWYADRTGRNGMGRDKTGRNGDGAKMPSDGNKEEEEGDEEVIILCSTDVERGGEAKRKFIQNSSRRTARSTHFRRTKRETERLVSLRFVPSHVPNDTLGTVWYADGTGRDGTGQSG
ncbi:hypothetical protein DVH24_027157 [Malus domestica]|uniref:Uncharacterized protein n=1 Tax=Malus domestica TaxID=3750 RepID=A0A498IL25_MALDO|nr:hypothetical protein DVH24_027157 [Malus domestica]